MKHSSALLLVGALLLTVVSGVRAERADRDQPMHIEADSLLHDETTQTSVFTGNVVITKGTIVLRGGRVEVHQDPQGYQSGVVTAAAGKRAFFRQRRDTAKGAPEEYMEGEAAEIVWDGRADTVRLKRSAELRRLRAGVLTDDVSGALITYNNATDVFTVDGAPRQAGNKTDGRVRATLAPKETPAPAAAGQTGAPALRTSPELGPPPQ